MPIEMRVEERGLKRLALALQAEANGRKMRNELLKSLRSAVNPGVREARRQILSMPSGGRSHGASLRAAIAAAVRAEARLTGDLAGVRVRARNRGMPRRFGQAPKRTNTGEWRHPVFGHSGVWVHQRGKAGWFDDTLAEGRSRYRLAIHRVMEDTARRIAGEG